MSCVIKKQNNNSDGKVAKILSQSVQSITNSLWWFQAKKKCRHSLHNQPRANKVFFLNTLCVSSETGSWNVQSGDRSICWWGRCLKSQQSGGAVCVATPDISPVVILRWERMCSLRLMTCLSKRKSPPFSEAQQLPSSRERNQIKERRVRIRLRTDGPLFARCLQRTTQATQVAPCERALKVRNVSRMWRKKKKKKTALKRSSEAKLCDPVRPPTVQTIRKCQIHSSQCPCPRRRLPTHITTSRGNIQPGLTPLGAGRSHIFEVKIFGWRKPDC